ncbi:hypothetical protein H257_02887 [Aphanomyces astaci]|uniref:DDE-1 domain-containing protein n=1 Tax=Aphanomyces astaci TaxID=112090 RepID=W4H156_APHAT|nr:hypothetical protein H257_02887 [Aphanomyces astaci]ETV84994.1 hypothetical protein H257_02887 [Aphanomyces astaci]|eukprot:XP_009825012.1 hypothetical protein H257_02887 [Aphanomyces astaci]
MRPRKRNQNSYKNEERKFFLNKFKATHGVSERQFCRDNKLAFSTWQGWRTNEAKILASKRHGRLATLGGQGLRELIPFKNELLAFMRDRRGTERYVRVFHLMRWVKRHHRPWLVDYLSTKKNDAVGYNSFRTLLLRFSYRHRFRHRVPCKSKLSQQVLDDVWLGYAASFWNKYSEYDKSQILNVDETALLFVRKLVDCGIRDKRKRCRRSILGHLRKPASVHESTHIVMMKVDDDSDCRVVVNSRLAMLLMRSDGVEVAGPKIPINLSPPSPA